MCRIIGNRSSLNFVIKTIMKLLSTKQVVIRISVIIAMAEFLIMLILQYVPFALNTLTEAMVDTTMLILISTPLIYGWVIAPFVKARDAALEQISLLAYTDPLTKIANRRHFLSHLEKAVHNISRRNSYGAVMLLDLNGFKKINDDFGHEAGDAVLVEIANRFSSSIRAGDVLARLGGDEFVTLADNLDIDKINAQDKAILLAEKLINQATLPIDYHGYQLQVGASVGIYIMGKNVANIDTIISRADNAMYSAKKSGKGHSVFSD